VFDNDVRVVDESLPAHDYYAVEVRSLGGMRLLWAWLVAAMLALVGPAPSYYPGRPWTSRTRETTGGTRSGAWIAELSASGLSAATVVKAGQIMNKILRSAVEEGMISTKPCGSVQLPRIERQEMRFLSPTEVATLARRIDRRYSAAILLGAYCGLRAGELFGLRVKRVDLGGRRIDVVEQVVEVAGVLHFGAAKTRAGRRSVPVPRLVIEALKEHLESWPSEDLVFTATDGGPVRLATWRSRFFEPAVNAAKVAPLRVPALRHTAVSLSGRKSKRALHLRK
jgi:integrase